MNWTGFCLQIVNSLWEAHTCKLTFLARVALSVLAALYISVHVDYRYYVWWFQLGVAQKFQKWCGMLEQSILRYYENTTIVKYVAEYGYAEVTTIHKV